MKDFLKLFIAIFCLLPFTAQGSYLNIDIANKTNSTCFLVDEQLLQGMLWTTAPSSIQSHESGKFMMWQSTFSRGPKIILTYMCGKNTVSFLCQESTTLIGYGKLSAELMSATSEITATFRSTEGSILWSQLGRINVIISEVNPHA